MLLPSLLFCYIMLPFTVAEFSLTTFKTFDPRHTQACTQTFIHIVKNNVTYLMRVVLQLAKKPCSRYIRTRVPSLPSLILHTGVCLIRSALKEHLSCQKKLNRCSVPLGFRLVFYQCSWEMCSFNDSTCGWCLSDNTTRTRSALAFNKSQKEI
jgi:hypothetical protein